MHSCGGEKIVPRISSATKPIAVRAGQPPSRTGKKGVTFYLEPDAVKQLRTIGVNEDTTLQALMVEATNMLFKRRGKPVIAK